LAGCAERSSGPTLRIPRARNVGLLRAWAAHSVQCASVRWGVAWVFALANQSWVAALTTLLEKARGGRNLRETRRERMIVWNASHRMTSARRKPTAVGPRMHGAPIAIRRDLPRAPADSISRR